MARNWKSRSLLLSTSGDLIASRSLGAIQRAIRGDQHVLVLLLRLVLGDPNARRHEPFRIAHPHTRLLHRGAHLLRDAARPLFPSPYQYHNELVAAIPPRERIHRGLLLRQHRLALQIAGARLERRPPLRRSHRELLARPVAARSRIPVPAVGRQTNLLEDLLHGFGRGP